MPVSRMLLPKVSLSTMAFDTGDMIASTNRPNPTSHQTRAVGTHQHRFRRTTAAVESGPQTLSHPAIRTVQHLVLDLGVCCRHLVM